jgi:NAD(P)-dependent dehydrogenase (short-subunit alcohol dehydrogenase family)
VFTLNCMFTCGEQACRAGANTGIGYITARELAAKGYHTVLACRNESKGQEAVRLLRSNNPSASFELRILDLADLSSVSNFCKATCDAGVPIDVLVNNAGVMACPEMATKDGFEYQIGINHFGHFALTSGLLPLLTQHDRYGCMHAR